MWKFVKKYAKFFTFILNSQLRQRFWLRKTFPALFTACSSCPNITDTLSSFIITPPSRHQNRWCQNSINSADYVSIYLYICMQLLHAQGAPVMLADIIDYKVQSDTMQGVMKADIYNKENRLFLSKCSDWCSYFLASKGQLWDKTPL